MKLYDTYQKQIVEISTHSEIEPVLKIYSCGPTVYGYQHIGNYRAAWLPDTITKLAKLSDIQVQWVLNITDVGHLVGDVDGGEDKISLGARRDDKTVDEIVTYYENNYFTQAEALNLTLPDGFYNPRATDYIKEQMVLAVTLWAEEKAYLLEDGIYFDSQANLDLDVPFKLENLGGVQDRELANSTKNPADFALWKFVSDDTIQKWKFEDYDEVLQVLANCPLPATWRNNENLPPVFQMWGCPGWHSECVAMICRILGKKLIKNRDLFSFSDFANKTIIDIHTGGEDHIDLHHRNEILQSKALGFDLSKNWVHNKFVTVDGKKMSKSLGNLYTVLPSSGFVSLKEKGFDVLAYKLMMFEHHYNSQLDFTWEKLGQSQARLFGLRQEMAKINSFMSQYYVENESFVYSEEIKANWLEILGDNLNVPKFLEEYQKTIMSLVNQIKTSKIDKDLARLVCLFEDEFLQLNLKSNEDSVWVLGQKRQIAKESKQYDLCDQIRDQITGLGYQIDDYSWGFGIWKNK
jgi:cysteinyl-tRNA synthetase